MNLVCFENIEFVLKHNKCHIIMYKHNLVFHNSKWFVWMKKKTSLEHLFCRLYRQNKCSKEDSSYTFEFEWIWNWIHIHVVNVALWRYQQDIENKTIEWNISGYEKKLELLGRTRFIINVSNHSRLSAEYR